MSSWEVVETVSDESLTCAVRRSTCRDSPLPEECEAVEVFDEGVESVEVEGGGDAVPAIDNGSGELSAGVKKNWMRKLSQHAKLQKLNLHRASLRHASVPDSAKETPSTAAALHFRLNFSKSSPFIEVPPSAGIETRTPPDDRRADDNAAGGHGNSKFKKVVHGMMRARDHADEPPSPPRRPQPHTAPPIVSRQDEHTLLNRVNKKLINYLRVVRTAVSDSAGDGNKGRRAMRLVRVIDLTSDNEVSVATITYAEYLTLGMWFYSFAF